MDTNEELRKCDTCKIVKPKSLFYRYKYCNKCYYTDTIKNIYQRFVLLIN